MKRLIVIGILMMLSAVTFAKTEGQIARDIQRNADAVGRSNVVYIPAPGSGVTNANEIIESKMANDTVIYLMDGLYQISGDITLTGYSNLTIEGMGPQTIIKNVGTGNYCCIFQKGPGHDLIIRNLTVDNNNIGNPFAAFNKCIFINGNQADPSLCYNILVEGVTAINAEAEALCFDYQFFTTVRNCIIEDAAWAGITMAQNKYSNIYNNKINRSGNSPAVVGTLCAGINVQSSPFTLVHDNWIRNPWYGGIGVSTSMDTYGPSHGVSVYGNIINGHLSGSGTGNSQGAIDVGISGTTATIVPYNIDIYANHVYQNYLSAVQFTISNKRLACSGVTTTPFVDVEIGDKIYLDGDGDTNTDGNVNDGYYYVSDVDEKEGIGDTARDWIELEMPHAYVFMPTNPEAGDVYSITVTLDGVDSTKSYTADSTPTVTEVINGLKAAIATSHNATATDPWIYIRTSVNYPVGDTSNPTKLFLTACTRGSQYEFTATAAVTNAGGSLTPTISAARYYGLRNNLSSGLTFLHGMSSAGVYVTDGTNIRIHDNTLNGYGTGAGILMASDIAAGSNVFAWDNIFGSNYTYRIRSLVANQSVSFKNRPDAELVPRTATTTCYYYPNNTTFTNAGATGAIEFDLPPAKVGDKFNFRVAAAQALRIDPDGTEIINAGVGEAAGNYIGCATVGASATVECLVAGQWEFYATGTWDDE